MTHFLIDPILHTLPGYVIIDAPVPYEYRTLDNPDGQTPDMTMTVTADTLRIALEGLYTLHDKVIIRSMIVNAAFHAVRDMPLPNDGMYPNLYRALLNHDVQQLETPGTAASQQFQEFLSYYTEWIEFNSELVLLTDDGSQFTVGIEINAPGYLAAQQMLYHATHEDTVREIAETQENV